jgi:hypothetical protein
MEYLKSSKCIFFPFVLGMDDSSYKLNLILIQARIEEQKPYQHS